MRKISRSFEEVPMESNTTLTLGSLFDGSGGFPMGGLIAGITPVWASEIEPFPIRVTTKRLPFMKHYGDISQMDGRKIEPVDIITFGSPCTDMSIAGRRAGLDGKQSSLFYQAIRIIQKMREATHGRYPRYIVWENVPGAVSYTHLENDYTASSRIKREIATRVVPSGDLYYFRFGRFVQELLYPMIFITSVTDMVCNSFANFANVDFIADTNSLVSVLLRSMAKIIAIA